MVIDQGITGVFDACIKRLREAFDTDYKPVVSWDVLAKTSHY